jgi:hypothetical protein
MLRKWDFFISHASEDKADVVEPLAIELTARGAAVWYDRWTLQIGDSLSEKIDEGLASSEFGIVVLSPHFFAKSWPKRELGGLVQREIGGKKVILPVWHGVDHAFVAQHSPTLADKMAGSTIDGIPTLAERLVQATGKTAEEAKRPDKLDVVHSAPAKIEIAYRNLSITSDLHRYTLTVVLTLFSPPDQGKLRLRFLWPANVRITNLRNVRERGGKHVDGVDYKELVVDWEERVFPGETTQMLGPGSAHEIEYEYDHHVYLFLRTNPRQLHYTLFFEDHNPVTGAKPFSELNIF